MNKNRRISNMLVSTGIMALLAIVLLAIGYSKGEHISGLKIALKMGCEVLPLLIFAFIIAGMVQVILPKELVLKWIGKESGIKGILIGTIAGSLAPGGPYVNLPLVAGLLKLGAGTGTMVSFLTGWLLLSISRLPMEVGILGWRFTFIRLMCTFFFPPIAGLIAQKFFGG
jgi:uncharacterized membrane protein YraQ (UPF0718 family)